MKILLLGATGLVGGHVLNLSLNHPSIEQVIAPVRNPLKVQHEKLYAPIINFDDFATEAESWQFDAVICTLGTTMKKAKSKAVFQKIDYEYPLVFAKLAQQKNVKIYVLNSAAGAKADSLIFYNQVKGRLEQQLQNMQFESLLLVRPGLISGDRQEKRLAEDLALKLSGIFHAILPKALQPNQAQDIAFALLNGVLHPRNGVQIIESKDIHR